MTTRLPIIAVATTYAGSEATPVWGLTENGRKATGTDLAVLPRVVSYDPELTASMPPSLVAASGFNALAHCVEAFWAPGRNPVTSVLAAEGIRSLVAGLVALSADSADLEGHGQALYGAYLAGSAFASAGSGLHHKICHVLGGAYNLPHAETHAVVLPYVVAFNAARASGAAGRIAGALHAEDAAQGLRALADRLGLPQILHGIGFRQEDIPAAARLVQEVVPTDNPRPVTTDHLERLLQAAWAGMVVGQESIAQL